MTVRPSLLAGWVAFVYLAAGSSSASVWSDAGQRAATGWDLGVLPGPGSPGLPLLWRAATLLPIGSLAFRMTLISAACGAIAIALLVAILRRRGVSPALAAGAAAWVLVDLTFVRQARVLDEHAFATALAMLVLWGLDPAVPGSRRTERRLLAVLAATWAVWCFFDLRVALGPLIVVMWWRAAKAERAWARWAPLMAAIASMVVLSIPLASASDPLLDPGDPETLRSLWDHVRIVQPWPPLAAEHLVDRAGVVLGTLAEDLGAPGLVAFALAIGRAAWVGPRGELVVVAWIAGVQIALAIVLAPIEGEDRHAAMLVGPLAAILVAHQLHVMLVDRPLARVVVLPLVGAVLVLAAAIASVGDIATTRSWAAHARTRDALARLPPRAAVAIAAPDLAAGVLAARVLEGARPDAVVIAIPRADADVSP